MSQTRVSPSPNPPRSATADHIRGPEGTRPSILALDPSTIRPDTAEYIRTYTATMVHELERCVAAVDRDAEEALWRARRAVEALTCILICAHQNRAHKNDGDGEKLHGQIQELRKNEHISEAIDKKLYTVRSAANVGTHVRRDGADAAAALVGDVRKPLSDLVRWLYTESAARDVLANPARAFELATELNGERAHQARVQSELESLHQAHRTELQAVHAAHERERAGLREELAAMAERERRLHTALQAAEARALSAERERSSAELAAKRCAQELETARKQGVAAGPRSPSLGLFASLARWIRFILIATLCAGTTTAIALAGMLMFHGELRAWFARSPSPAFAVTQTPVSPAATVIPPPSNPAPVAPAQCPAGTVRVGPDQFRLDQPEGRSSWPKAPKDKKQVDVSVGAFCIEHDRVLRTDLPADLELDESTQTCLTKTTETWLACLQGNEAEAVCARRLPGGRLPTIAEWEALARATTSLEAVVTTRSRQQLEWVGDHFPPEVFARPSDGTRQGNMTRKRFDGEPLSGPAALHWAYNQPPDRKKQAGLIGFRCATSLKTDPLEPPHPSPTARP